MDLVLDANDYDVPKGQEVTMREENSTNRYPPLLKPSAYTSEFKIPHGGPWRRRLRNLGLIAAVVGSMGTTVAVDAFHKLTSPRQDKAQQFVIDTNIVSSTVKQVNLTVQPRKSEGIDLIKPMQGTQRLIITQGNHKEY